MKNRESSTEPCYMNKCTRSTFRWWPHTEEGLLHKGQSMVACPKHFHELWAGEN